MSKIKKLRGIKQLLEFPAYLKLLNEIEARIKTLDEEIITSLGEGELKYTTLDIKRVERMLLKQFTELPENILEEFDNIVKVEEEE